MNIGNGRRLFLSFGFGLALLFLSSSNLKAQDRKLDSSFSKMTRYTASGAVAELSDLFGCTVDESTLKSKTISLLGGQMGSFPIAYIQIERNKETIKSIEFTFECDGDHESEDSFERWFTIFTSDLGTLNNVSKKKEAIWKITNGKLILKNAPWPYCGRFAVVPGK